MPPRRASGTCRAGGAFTPIAVPGAVGETDPLAINALGSVVGFYDDGTGLAGFILSGGAYAAFPQAPGFTDTLPSKINGFDQVVGTYTSADRRDSWLSRDAGSRAGNPCPRRACGGRCDLPATPSPEAVAPDRCPANNALTDLSSSCGWPASRVCSSRVTDVTAILSAIDAGDVQAAADLLPLVYAELRKLATAQMAREQPGQTLQATGLVHEAYLRLVGLDPANRWSGRGHFFAAAAEAMRRILIDRARGKRSLRRGGRRRRRELSEGDRVDLPLDSEVLDLDEA